MLFMTLVAVPKNVSAAPPVAFLYVYNTWLHGAGAVLPHAFSFELMASETIFIPASCPPEHCIPTVIATLASLDPSLLQSHRHPLHPQEDAASSQDERVSPPNVIVAAFRFETVRSPVFTCLPEPTVIGAGVLPSGGIAVGSVNA